MEAGDNAAIVEDVITTGGSVIKAIEAVRDKGASIAGVFVIVDREEGAENLFRKIGVPLFSIFRIGELL